MAIVGIGQVSPTQARLAMLEKENRNLHNKVAELSREKKALETEVELLRAQLEKLQNSSDDQGVQGRESIAVTKIADEKEKSTTAIDIVMEASVQGFFLTGQAAVNQADIKLIIETQERFNLARSLLNDMKNLSKAEQRMRDLITECAVCLPDWRQGFEYIDKMKETATVDPNRELTDPEYREFEKIVGRVAEARNTWTLCWYKLLRELNAHYESEGSSWQDEFVRVARNLKKSGDAKPVDE